MLAKQLTNKEYLQISGVWIRVWSSRQVCAEFPRAAVSMAAQQPRPSAACAGAVQPSQPSPAQPSPAQQRSRSLSPWCVGGAAL